MEKTVLIEQTAKKIKLAELIVLMCLFGSIAAGLERMSFRSLSGIVMLCIDRFLSLHSAASAFGDGG